MTAPKTGDPASRPSAVDQRNILIINQLKKNLGEHICFTPVKDKMGGFTVAAIVSGESGYAPLYTLFYGSQEEMASVCRALNETAGVTEQKVIEWVTQSMFPPKKHKG